MDQEKQCEKKQRKKKTVGQVFSNIILVFAIGVFLFSGYKLYEIYSEYNKGVTEYDNIQEIVIQEKEPENVEETPTFVVDFEALKAINGDTVAWIRFDEPAQISYPVVKGLDNSKYLKTTFEGNRNAAGTIFMDVDNAGDFTDRNTFIYGHNMKNGSMFAQLRKYKAKEFCDQNPFFYIYTPDGEESVYQIFAVSIVKDTSRSYQKYYANDTDFADYISYVRQGTLYATNVEVGSDDQIVSLSTCTNVRADERILVQGVKISGQSEAESTTDNEADGLKE